MQWVFFLRPKQRLLKDNVFNGYSRPGFLLPPKKNRVGEFSAWSSDANPSPVQAELSEMRQELAVKASIIQWTSNQNGLQRTDHALKPLFSIFLREKNNCQHISEIPSPIGMIHATWLLLYHIIIIFLDLPVDRQWIPCWPPMSRSLRYPGRDMKGDPDLKVTQHGYLRPIKAQLQHGYLTLEGKPEWKTSVNRNYVHDLYRDGDLWCAWESYWKHPWKNLNIHI